jgi:hypothetical protein
MFSPQSIVRGFISPVSQAFSALFAFPLALPSSIGTRRALSLLKPRHSKFEAAKHSQPEDDMKTAAPTTLRTTDSTVRTPSLSAAPNQSKPIGTPSGVASRFLNALMRALAAPHI